MDKQKLNDLLHAVARGNVSPAEACDRLQHLPYEDLGFARVDSHRGLRQGLPEVVFCPGKTASQIAEIMRKLSENHGVVLATRASAETAAGVKNELPHIRYLEQARALILGDMPASDVSLPSVNIITAGTADIPIAEEAALVVEASAVCVKRTYDVGVAGIHRLLDSLPKLRANPVSICVAGMDGVLPSVVAGLLPGIVIAVPTSVGYGANFQGVAPLLTMLNSCAAGLTVVNIDNGFGAGAAAVRALTVLMQPARPVATGELD